MVKIVEIYTEKNNKQQDHISYLNDLLEGSTLWGKLFFWWGSISPAL